eukprot:6211202-Pleurochrysis_carterae.AAC.1
MRCSLKKCLEYLRNMRTGYDNIIHTVPNDGREELRRIVERVVTVCVTEAAKTAAVFSTACGRNAITVHDVILALRYEAMTIVGRDCFTRAVEDEAGESESEEGCESSESSGGDDASTDGSFSDDDEFTDTAIDDAHPAALEIHRRVLAANAAFGRWDPVDFREQVLREAVLRTIARLDDRHPGA